MPRFITSTSNQNVDISPNGSGLFTIKASATGLNNIINDNTMATATTSNINTSSATKTYIDNRSVFGNWTPSITFATPGTLSVSYTTQLGRYLQVINSSGVNFIFIWGTVVCSSFSLGTASGQFRISGLPFASSSSIGVQNGVVPINSSSNFVYQGGTTLVGFTSAGSTYLEWNSFNSSVVMNLTTSGFSASNPSLNFNGWYIGN